MRSNDWLDDENQFHLDGIYWQQKCDQFSNGIKKEEKDDDKSKP